MNVKLLSITNNAEYIIASCARVSNPQNQGKPYAKLIRYLIEHKHWSPFEMAHAIFDIETSRAISAQLIRHKSFSFQEWSQRYSEATSFEPIQLRKQAEKNRQSSAEPLDDALMDSACQNRIYEVLDAASALYADMLSAGIARECARMILPMATTTRLYMAGNIRSWIHYLDVRCQEDTQLEHRQIAEAIRAQLAEQMPLIAEAVGWIHEQR